MRGYKYYSILTGIFAACLVISNVLDTKLFTFFNLSLPAGIIIFPITYLFGDILTEVYGYANARKVIWTGLMCLVLFVAVLSIVQILPPAAVWTHQSEFELILGKVPRIVAASITAYFLGEFANSYTLSKLKLKDEGKRMPKRFVVSTLVGEGVDTIVFVIIAFAGQMPFNVLVSITISAWLFKVIWEVVMLPITIPVVKWLKRKENEDHFDRNVNYNIFKIVDNAG